MGAVARCPAYSFRDEGALGGAPRQVMQGPAALLFPLELCVIGGEAVLSCLCLICLLSVEDPTCSTKLWNSVEKKCGKNTYAQQSLCLFGKRSRAYISELPFSQACLDLSALPKEMHFVQCVLNVLCTLRVCYTLHTPNVLPVL